MKKLILTAFVALLAAPCFAQYDAVYTSDNGKFSFDLIDHMGVGYNFVDTDDFTPSGSLDFFMNIAKIGLRPVQNFGLDMGVDLQFYTFSSKENAFAQENRIIKPTSFSSLDILVDSFDKKRGSFSTFGLSAPVLLKGIFNDFEIGVGAVVSWNIEGDTYATVRKDHKTWDYRESNAKVNPFSYCFLATVSYDELGVYLKYNPKSSRLLPDGSIDMSFITLGVAFNL
ncbi:MAG: hypothetical protein IKV62_01000 [Bacteroidales bacterium]|nr:hypothetical protein [Bacteroidales bacterium]